jgi:hypothetical protein
MIKADFIVDSEYLKKVIIKDPVAIKFIDISNIKFLGETGKKMALAGFKFFVTKKLADKLVQNKEAVLYIENLQ